MKQPTTNEKSPMKPKTAPPGHRCPDCGVLVAPGPFESPRPERRWVRCEPCRMTPDVIAAVLAHSGIEEDPTDPAVIHGMARVRWRARAIEHARVTREATRAAGPQGSLPDGAYAAEVQRASLRLDTIGTPSGEPWAHLDRGTRTAIRAAVKAARRDLADADRPRPCKGGPCGICGACLALTWPASVRVSAPGGIGPGKTTTWPVCSRCEPVLNAAGGDPTSERARRSWTALVLDRPATPPAMSLPALVRCYAEFIGTDTDPRSAEGCTTPWGFVTATDREVLAGKAPQHRPPEVLDRERRLATTRARIDATRRAREPRSALAGGDPQ
jgi:hypothetical protein